MQVVLNTVIFCCDFDLKNILIECDSYLVAGWVNNENNWPWKLLDILIECDP